MLTVKMIIVKNKIKRKARVIFSVDFGSCFKKARVMKD